MQALRFGVSRLHGGAELAPATRAFVSVLAAQLGQPVHEYIVEDYHALLAALLADEVQVAWLPPRPLARALEEGAVLACLSQRRGRLLYRSALVGRADGPSTLAALRSPRIAWTNASSTGGYLVPRAMLREHGLDPSTLASEGFFGSTLLSCAAVAAGDADVATCYVTDAAAADPFVAEREVAQALGETLASQLRVLAISGPIPPDGMALSAALPATARAQLRTALAEYHLAPGGGEALGKLLQAERLTQATYEAMRLLTRLRVELDTVHVTR
jgi:phosphate/phosphite/phosphonate ABC transporter binding protein